MNPKRSSFTLLQASQNNPGLANLMALQQASSERLHAIKPLIPPLLQSSVHCGPLEDGVWCLLLANNTTAAKLRQLVPTFLSQLRAKGVEVKSIRLKVMRQEK